ncbi:MAG: hypothetical protein WKF67_13245 [Rubrobacteraceae bacterium]
MRPRASMMVLQDEEILASPESVPYNEQGYTYNTVTAHPVTVC